MAAKGLIRLDDPTSHGGKVISATSRFIVDGKPVARVGDKCSCPIPGHGSETIVEGDPDWTIDGMPLAYEGCKTDKGATLITTTGLAKTNGPCGDKVSSGAASSHSSSSSSTTQQEGDQHFVLTDEKTGSPLINVAYEINTKSGRRISGRTNEKGQTGLITGEVGVDANIIVFEDPTKGA